jgi:hypothetical protein
MKKEKQPKSERLQQPQPFTPGITKTMVREHAFALYRDKLAHDQSLTLQDWVLAEKDLVKDLDTGNAIPS